MAVVVDTDVVSFVFKKDTRKESYDCDFAGQFMFLSFMTLAELRKWSLAWNWSTKKNKLLMLCRKRIKQMERGHPCPPFALWQTSRY